ncbi:MAG: hypothetical protein CEO40_138 [Parcubacteria group bacterium LiPW_72]|nr:MAG: hypothetical protein CEO40_138 [Parcubacteria group bacterium LiPW_72]
MTILFFGDIVGRPGRLAVKKILPELKKAYEPDLILANCENLAHGKGVTRETLSVLRESGIEIFTSGNHVFNQKQAHEILREKDSDLLRPANYPPGVPGRGFKVMEIGTKKMAVVNLVGRVFFDEDFDCPFRCADEILEELKEKKNQNHSSGFSRGSDKRSGGFGLVSGRQGVSCRGYAYPHSDCG